MSAPEIRTLFQKTADRIWVMLEKLEHRGSPPGFLQALSQYYARKHPEDARLWDGPGEEWKYCNLPAEWEHFLTYTMNARLLHLHRTILDMLDDIKAKINAPDSTYPNTEYQERYSRLRRAYAELGLPLNPSPYGEHRGKLFEDD